MARDAKRRAAAADRRRRETQAAQRAKDEKKLTLAQYRRRRIVGWSLVGLGVGVAAQHLVSHLGFFVLISKGWDDLVAGYPLAGLLGIAGAIVLSKA